MYIQCRFSSGFFLIYHCLRQAQAAYPRGSLAELVEAMPLNLIDIDFILVFGIHLPAGILECEICIYSQGIDLVAIGEL